MAFHQGPFQLLDDFTQRIRLPQDIHAILILFDHFPNSTQVSLRPFILVLVSGAKWSL
jgi:hypothetical protein